MKINDRFFDGINALWETICVLYLPLLCVFGVLIISVVFWVPGLILKFAGENLISAGCWIKDRLVSLAN
jgi:hypothetical protein